jgi:serine/threonine-protein kinase
VKVLDFGLAKAFEPEVASGSSADLVNSPTLTIQATTAGMLMGTAAYMSPEQARGKSVDKRADIWAFGVVLYEMLTGREMFAGETLSDTLAGVLRAPFDWDALPTGTPPALRRLLERCLERDPKRRLRDMGDAWIEIDAPAGSTPPVVAAPPVAPSRFRWIPWAVAAVIAATGIAWGLLHTPAVPPMPVVRWTYSQEKPFVALTLSRDGTRLAYMDIFENNNPRLMLRSLDQQDAKPLPGGEQGLLPIFSPDGQWLAFLQGANDFKLKKIPITGGTAITLCDAGTPTGIDWYADDSIVFSTGKGLMRVSASGGAPETLTTPDAKKGEIAHRWPNVLPGGQAVLFSIANNDGSQVAVLDLKSRKYRVLVPNGSNPRYVPSGHLVFYRSGTIFAVPFDAKAIAITGSEAPVVENVSVLAQDAADYSTSNSGLLVYVEGGSVGSRTILKWMDRKGVGTPITDSQMWGTGRLSPDGRHIANGIHAGKDEDIWVVELERNTKTRLTFGGTNSFPIWTPDGKWITYTAEPGGKHGLWRVPADGSGKPEILLETDSAAVPHSWSPDAKMLIYSQPAADKKNHLWMVAVQPGQPAAKAVQLHDTPFFESEGQVSPDGKWLAYESSETGSREVYVQAFPGTGAKMRISTQSGYSPRWSRDGRELFYRTVSGVQDLMAVEVQSGATFHASIPQVLFKSPSGSTWDPSPDGKRFLMEQSEREQSGRKLVGVVNWFDELRRRVPVKR